MASRACPSRWRIAINGMRPASPKWKSVRWSRIGRRSAGWPTAGASPSTPRPLHRPAGSGVPDDLNREVQGTALTQAAVLPRDPSRGVAWHVVPSRHHSMTTWQNTSVLAPSTSRPRRRFLYPTFVRPGRHHAIHGANRCWAHLAPIPFVLLRNACSVPCSAASPWAHY